MLVCFYSYADKCMRDLYHNTINNENEENRTHYVLRKLKFNNKN